jgi:hypothetical protein
MPKKKGTQMERNAKETMVDLGGVARQVFFSWEGINAFEKEMGCRWLEFWARITDPIPGKPGQNIINVGHCSHREIMLLLWAGLLHGDPEITQADVMAWLTKAGETKPLGHVLLELYKPLVAALVRYTGEALPADPTEGQDSQPAGQVGKS